MKITFGKKISTFWNIKKMAKSKKQHSHVTATVEFIEKLRQTEMLYFQGGMDKIQCPA